MIVTGFRLNAAALAALEKSLPHPGAPVNPIEAGFQLGVQAVLKKLREGFTVAEQE